MRASNLILRASAGGIGRVLTIMIILVASSLVAGLGVAQTRSDPARSLLTAAGGYEGRIRLVRFLDEPDGYCLDVPGPPSNILLHIPVWAHTCHFDRLGDQVFRFNKDGDGRIRWKFAKYDLCLTARAAKAGANFKLVACDNPNLQRYDYTGVGEFRLRRTNFCIFVERTGPGPRTKAAAGQDQYGRGRPVNPQYSHLARRLELQPCGTGEPAMARWQAVLE